MECIECKTDFEEGICKRCFQKLISDNVGKMYEINELEHVKKILDKLLEKLKEKKDMEKDKFNYEDCW